VNLHTGIELATADTGHYGGTGACAAVVAGIRRGKLNASVQVHTHGGKLTVEWAGKGHPVLMTGPTATVFSGEIDV
jgi:diaminopimelate epimerase